MKIPHIAAKQKVFLIYVYCGLDHELLIAKSKIKLIKVGKNTRPFRYDLNQIPHDYTGEVRNRFKGLDLTDRMPEELWTKVYNPNLPLEKSVCRSGSNS